MRLILWICFIYSQATLNTAAAQCARHVRVWLRVGAISMIVYACMYGLSNTRHISYHFLPCSWRFDKQFHIFVDGKQPAESLVSLWICLSHREGPQKTDFQCPLQSGLRLDQFLYCCCSEFPCYFLPALLANSRTAGAPVPARIGTEDNECRLPWTKHSDA